MRSDLFRLPPAVDQNLGSLAGKEVKVVKYDAEPELDGGKWKDFSQGMEIEFTDGTRIIINALLVQESLGDAGYPAAHVPVLATRIV